MEQNTNVRPQLTFGEAISSGFKNYATFTGRARRSEYWWWQLFAFLVGLLSIIPILGWIISVAMILPNLAMAVRRLHDTERSGWWIAAPAGFGFLGVLFALGGIGADSTGVAIFGIILYACAFIFGLLIFIWTLFDSQPRTNKYGASPKYITPEA